MTDAEPIQLGRYELLRQIARGGMGEIYVARARGAVGFEKKVIIKRILPHLAEEQEFVDKFVDEAHIVTHLTHGNIVPVFDMGEENGELYIAMEYIAGRDLRDVLKRAKHDDFLLPVDVALYVAAETSKGLAYAHRRTDDAGQPLDLVHRDVSPSNILISKDGEVKIVDFGIAKASGKISKSITGRLQGKFCYMSPEQAAGRKVDHRSDIFSTGVVLYEMLTNTRPFEGGVDLESLDKVRNFHPPPPSSIRPEISAEVDAIVMRALEKDPDARYDHVDDFERAMLTHLYASGGLTSRQVAQALLELFPEGIERPEVRTGDGSVPKRNVSLDDALSAEMERLLSGKTPSHHGLSVDPLMDTATGVGTGGSSETRSLLVEGAAAAPVMADSGVKIRIGTPASGTDPDALARSTTAEMPELQGATPPAGLYELTPAGGLTPVHGMTPTGPLTIPPQRRSRASRYGIIAIVALVVLLAGAVGLLVWDSYFAAPTLIVRTVPAGASVLVDGAMAGKGGEPIDTLEPGEHRVTVHAEGYLDSEEQLVTLEPGRRSRLNVRLAAKKAKPKVHRVSFTTTPPGAGVFVLRTLRGTTPLEDVTIPATGADVRLTLAGHKDIEILLEPDKIQPSYSFVFAKDEAVVPVEPDAGTAQDTGVDDSPPQARNQVRVAITSSPPGAKIIVRGRSYGTTPRTVSLDEGNLIVRLEKEGYEPYIRRVNTKAQRKLGPTLKKKESSAPTGEEVVEPVPFKVRIYAPSQGNGPVPSTLKVGGQKYKVPASGIVLLRLKPGTYRATAHAPAYGLRASRSLNISASSANTRFDMPLRPLPPQ